MPLHGPSPKARIGVKAKGLRSIQWGMPPRAGAYWSRNGWVLPDLQSQEANCLILKPLDGSGLSNTLVEAGVTRTANSKRAKFSSHRIEALRFSELASLAWC